MQHSNLVLLRTCGSRAEADIAKSILEAEGIPVLSQADTAGGMREHLAWSGEGFQIRVREEDLAAAREILAAAQDAPLDDTDQIPENNS